LLTAELISTIVSYCHDEYKVKFTKVLTGMERLLGILNRYRKSSNDKKKIETEEEHEAIVNIIDTLASSMLSLSENISHFRTL
jgi:hypothetical protein